MRLSKHRLHGASTATTTNSAEWCIQRLTRRDAGIGLWFKIRFTRVSLPVFQSAAAAASSSGPVHGHVPAAAATVPASTAGDITDRRRGPGHFGVFFTTKQRRHQRDDIHAAVTDGIELFHHATAIVTVVTFTAISIADVATGSKKR